MFDHIHYDPGTGVFTHLTGRCKGRRAGWVDKDGYRRLRIDGKNFSANRLAWFKMTGVWPEGVIDHKNRDPSDDSWPNLRELTATQNKQNCSPRLGTKAPGVGPHQGGWRARIRINGKQILLGVFPDPETATRAYQAAKAEMHPAWSGMGDL